MLFAQPIGGTNFHGGGEYMKAVFQTLAKEYDGSFGLVVCYDTERFLDNWIKDLIREKSIHVVHVKTAEDIVQTVCCKAQSSEVRFFAGVIYPYARFVFPETVTRIGTCHGLRTLEKPYDLFAPLYIQDRGDVKEFIKYTLLKKRTRRIDTCIYENALRCFNIIITDSEHSMYSLKLNFSELMRSKEIRVYYPPEKHVDFLDDTDKSRVEPYILMISANRWLKNSYRGVKALDDLYQKGYLKGIKTKVYGDFPERIKKGVKCKECFDFFGYVSTDELELAYKNCEVFFYPTLNEGFGLPPMEAMKYGKTCVVSNVCSLPEIYGEAVYYCNPYDIMEMQNRLLHAVDMRISRNKIELQLKAIFSRQSEDLVLLTKLIKGWK